MAENMNTGIMVSKEDSETNEASRNNGVEDMGSGPSKKAVALVVGGIVGVAGIIAATIIGRHKKEETSDQETGDDIIDTDYDEEDLDVEDFDEDYGEIPEEDSEKDTDKK